IGLRGGVAPVRTYLDELLPDVLEGVVEPGLVFDLQLPFEQLADGYAAMTERRAIKAWAIAS
ncbi:MAG TPA: IMP dehydrogenase, partial [Microbacterium sp.]|nr:IMP dehydrogenase [Microbacterium sp.]